MHKCCIIILIYIIVNIDFSPHRSRCSEDADNVTVAGIPRDVHVLNSPGQENRRSHQRHSGVVDRQQHLFHLRSAHYGNRVRLLYYYTIIHLYMQVSSMQHKL